ncbi:Lrp/AsnC family transcriptional regulator [Amycolatopsis sp., V23-08]|uniref:Lrp/AsnC family transcriptional regulator n=1 Tax=Amycolatopsis heterodermiae TaxID=3110235 RepID=A0ABU5QWU1_9PSEU|nr:Lrp/AsnC family transcriptional regulator [Amycolatopsis sp., V23-08]MEA5357984.1 Lrp/AsnC family transcriptional regulator [Amycolatopsis sp., V23-08]
MSDKQSFLDASGDQTSSAGSAAGGLAGRTVAPLDDVDRAMLAELSADGRLAIRALAERLHISRTNAYARLERLMAEGVITGFGARIDPRRAGLGTSAYIMVTVEQTSWRTMATDLHEIPYVDHVTLVGGDFDILLLVRTPDNTTLRDVVLERLQALEGVRSTRTWLIFEELPGSVLA